MSKDNEISGSGANFFGNKTEKYLKKLSRESVEKHTNTSVLFFGVDYERSKKNFYGEMVIRVWKNTIGIEVKGIIQLDHADGISVEDIPNKTMNLNFSCYLDHLKELGIDPGIGDCFSTKNRIYMIYDKTLQDSNMVSVMTDREALYIKYDCIALDSEQTTLPGTDRGADGTKNDISGTDQTTQRMF